MLDTGVEVEVHQDRESLTFGTHSPQDVVLSFTIFADSAPARKQQFRLAEIDLDRRLRQAIDQAMRFIRRS